MELMNNIQTANIKVKEHLLREITTQSYHTWLTCVEHAFFEDSNIILTLNNDFEGEIVKTRYLELLTLCYQFYIKFEKIEVRVFKKKDEIINLALTKNELFKIKSASEMKEITTFSLEEKINVAETVQAEMKTILHDIELMAKTGKSNILLPMYSKQFTSEVISQIMDILKENLYGIDLKTFSDDRKYLEISWN